MDQVKNISDELSVCSDPPSTKVSFGRSSLSISQATLVSMVQHSDGFTISLAEGDS